MFVHMSVHVRQTLIVYLCSSVKSGLETGEGKDSNWCESQIRSSAHFNLLYKALLYLLLRTPGFVLFDTSHANS